jgi:hypothetical protein
MNDFERDVMDYVFTYTSISKLKTNKECLREFLDNFKYIIDNCLLTQELILCNKNRTKLNIKNMRLSRHHCILCDSIFTGKNKKNISLFLDICKTHCCSCNQTHVTSSDKIVNTPNITSRKKKVRKEPVKSTKYYVNKARQYFDIDNFIDEFLNFAYKSFKELFQILKESKITIGHFSEMLFECSVMLHFFQYLINHDAMSLKEFEFNFCLQDVSSQCKENCFVCGLLSQCLKDKEDVKNLLNIFLQNMRHNRHKKVDVSSISETQYKRMTPDMSFMKKTKNYNLFHPEYIKNILDKGERKILFSIFINNKDPNTANQWVKLFTSRYIFETLKEQNVFIKIIGVIRYFMLPIPHYKSNETKYLNYEELCALSRKEWKDYSIKHVDSFFKFKKLRESLVEMTPGDDDYYKRNYKNIITNRNILTDRFPKLIEGDIIERFCIVHLKIIRDCKRLLNIFGDINEIKFKKLNRYLSRFKLNVINDIFGNIVMSWIHVHKYRDRIFKQLDFKFDYSNEYTLDVLFDIDKLIADILERSQIEVDKDISSLEVDQDEEEYSPDTVQREIDRLKNELA